MIRGATSGRRRGRGWAHLCAVGVAATLALGATRGVFAQSALDEVVARSAADSAGAALDSLAGADSTAADSLGATPRAGGLVPRGGTVPRPQPPKKLAPKFEVQVQSNVTAVQLRGSAGANVGTLVGTDAQVTYTATNTSYRQQDRETEARDLSAALAEQLGDIAKLSFDFRRNTNYDENRVATGKVILESENSNATLQLDGGNRLTDGFRHHWAARGDFEDVQQISRGVDNNRSLAGAGLTSLWRHEAEQLDLTARYGFTRSTGTRQVRGLEDDATAERDTLAASADVELIPRLKLEIDGLRTGFVEQRLDFARNSSGVIDTSSTSGPKVAPERESTRGYRIDTRASSQLLPRLRVSGTGSVEYSETEFTFSRQGFVLRGTDQLQTDATFRYAEAGSLQVVYTFSDRYNDRRTRNDTRFRGRESAKAYGAEVGLEQKLFFSSSLEIRGKQTLEQNFFEEPGNNNDRDRLFERLDGGIKSTAIPYTTIDLGGTLSRTEDISISADRVGDNKEERLIEVRGSYSFAPPGGLRFAQTYRLQIRYIDFVFSDDRDQFNKQGQLNTQLDYELPLGADVGLDYVLDYRRTGTRDLSDPFRELYRRDQRRFDHRVTARFGVPVFGLNLDVKTERGFLREERGTRETNEDRGQLSASLSGNRRFFRNRLQLRLDVERVLQFGPRVRDEQKDYWVANTTLTVQF